MQSIHCKKKRENSQWVFGSKEMGFKPRPATETFPHHVFGWAAIFLTRIHYCHYGSLCNNLSFHIGWS